ncbi:hypothetical protein [Acholeplasma granularum]|uniref:hypothetical protein n=1 Tax=Acholeplasma granularum TaxID=264635 RepID=UPI0004B2753A|nr:hypothetical protein [Acholeplasma granularum]
MTTNNDKNINLKKTYLIASILMIIGTVIYSIWFLDLLIYFLIAGITALINYYFLLRIQKFDQINQANVYGTLLFRYLIYVVIAFLIIWLNRKSDILEYIGISLIVGFSVIQISTIINTITSRNGVRS